MEKGIEKGKKESLQETAIKMKEKNIPMEIIAEITNLKVKEIENL